MGIWNNSQGIQSGSVSPLIQTNPNINNTIVSVNGFESAKQFSTLPNKMYALFDANEDKVYIKQTDASNYPMYKTFKLVEVKDPVSQPAGNYVTVEEFEKFKEEILNGQQYIRKHNGKPKPSKWNQSNSNAGDEQPADATGDGNGEGV